MVKSRYEFILHVINHSTHHRGQIVTMCRRLGAVDNIPAALVPFHWIGLFSDKIGYYAENRIKIRYNRIKSDNI
jgi:hypothetical protein